jgi:signal transduction histidine kinase
MADLISISIEVGQRREAELALREARDNLEMKVAERTRDLEEANDRLKELDRLKSEFLATMSHELRTPLNSIIGFSGILQQGLTGPLNEEQKKQLGFVYSSAKHLLALINDLLDLSRVESGKMEIFRELTPIGEVVKSVVDSLAVLAQQKNLTLDVELDAPEVKLWIDRQKVTQILLNLVNNAIKFTEHGGVRIVTETTAEWLTITVSDTGIGIARENLARLFEAFRQVDGSARRVHEGTGLGLYLSRQLVTLLGGRIWAESEFGVGSRFSFRLPRESSSTPSYERNDPPRGR